jgi:hypothetical protein
MKDTSYSIYKPLCPLFNRSFNNNLYQFNRQIGSCYLCIYIRKENKDGASNNRPISLICVWKGMERIIFKYIYNYSNEHSLICQNQSGFPSRRFHYLSINRHS